MRVIICFAIVLSIACSSKQEKSETVVTQEPSTVKSDLPNFPVSLIDGQQLNTQDLKGKVILILFQPDCDHCQSEAEAIESNMEIFKDYQLYFLSSASQEEITKFAVDYKLRGKDNVNFGMTGGEYVYITFGPISVPSIYIYNENGQLVKSFNGETPIEEIREVL